MSHIRFQGDALLSSMMGSGWNNRYFIDTEFTDFEQRQLISLAIVGENGGEFYGERVDFDATSCSEFVRAVVLPQLGRVAGRAMQLTQLREVLRNWFDGVPVASSPVLCYDLDADIDLLRELLGGRLPLGWALENVAARIDPRRRAAYFARHGREHHALHDARASAYACTG
ncbi:MAG: 3'-5' exoribonuclease.1 [Burkholderia lata]|uniref:3'-5' exoribonuclease.1 n=1 Tax=Burkholderia lata (strain ATCC 17760 / DSM 23089 / LMG 22485 / NCIMB 9086 / R18194 / 383) TaxID=482957 RepID=A0A833PSY4_BURL3|nr:3'-5' exoribonuclease [Burkholderia lata]KAF1037014.1 MAG: 3'-5' exoribonuclease.1 [Burkholderia lata]